MGKRQLRIPTSGLETLRTLLELDEKGFQRLSAAYGSVLPLLPTSDFSRRVADESGIAFADVEGITGMLIALSHFLYSGVFSRDELVSQVSDTPSDFIETDNRPEGWRETLSRRLDLLLSKDDGIGVVAKAVSLRSSDANEFVAAQIVTNIRPIFKPNTDSVIAASIIIHDLKLSYIEDDGPRDFHVALSTQQIIEVREALNRAENKAKAIREAMNLSDATMLGEAQ